MMLLIPEAVGTLLLSVEKASVITNLQCICNATLQYSDNTLVFYVSEIFGLARDGHVTRKCDQSSVASSTLL